MGIRAIVYVADGAVAARVLAVAAGARDVEIAARARDQHELVEACDTETPQLLVMAVEDATSLDPLFADVNDAMAGRPVGVLAIGDVHVPAEVRGGVEVEVHPKASFMTAEGATMAELGQVMRRLGEAHVRALPQTMDIDAALGGGEIPLD